MSETKRNPLVPFVNKLKKMAKNAPILKGKTWSSSSSSSSNNGPSVLRVAVDSHKDKEKEPEGPKLQHATATRAAPKGRAPPSRKPMAQRTGANATDSNNNAKPKSSPPKRPPARPANKPVAKPVDTKEPSQEETKEPTTTTTSSPQQPTPEKKKEKSVWESGTANTHSGRSLLVFSRTRSPSVTENSEDGTSTFNEDNMSALSSDLEETDDASSILVDPESEAPKKPQRPPPALPPPRHPEPAVEASIEKMEANEKAEPEEEEEDEEEIPVAKALWKSNGMNSPTVPPRRYVPPPEEETINA